MSVIAHSMGGVLTRMALWKSGSGEAGWPTAKLRVEHAVTLGTPHDGSREYTSAACPTRQYVNQCLDLTDGSGFLATMRNAPASRHPRGAIGAEWSAVASPYDVIVSVASALAVEADHEYVYYGKGCANESACNSPQYCPTWVYHTNGTHPCGAPSYRTDTDAQPTSTVLVDGSLELRRWAVVHQAVLASLNPGM